MKFITKTYLTCSLLALGGGHAFSQFSGDLDNSYGAGGKLWYNYDGSISPITSEKMVLDETGGHLFLSGHINDGSSDNAMIVKSNLDGHLVDEVDMADGTLSYNYLADPLYNTFSAMSVQTNGKMIGVGKVELDEGNTDIVIARFETDGSLDPTFNDGGELVVDIAGGRDIACDIAIQSDGKIIVVGAQEIAWGFNVYDVFIARLNADGSYDGTFGDGGLKVISTTSGVEFLQAVAILSDGKIMAVGHATNESGSRLIAIKLNEDGSLDTEFSDDGITSFKINELNTVANKIVEVADGVLITGNTDIDSEEENGINGFVVKLDNAGAVDLGFSETGIYIPEFEIGMTTDTTFAVRDLELLPSGKILVSGDYITGSTSATGLILLLADGSLDTDFGDNGLRTYHLDGGAGDNLHERSQIEVTSTNRVYLSAQVTAGAFQNIIVVRLFADLAGTDDLADNKLNFTIYPNPSSSELNVLYNNESGESISIQIVDLSGRILISKELSGLAQNQNTITLTNEVSNLLSGTYVVCIRSNGNQTNQTFVKL